MITIRHIYIYIYIYIYIAFYIRYVFFQIKLDHFVPMESALFVQELRTEKQTGNVVSAQNGCARTTISRQFK